MEERILSALKTVIDPDLQQDLVSLGMIQDIVVHPEWVQFRVVLTTPACPVKKALEDQCRLAVQAVVEGRAVHVIMDAKVVKPPLKGHSGSIEGVAHIIAVSSGKGGVGKSTVAVNLAISLARHGAKVGLLDADVYGPNIPTMLGAFQKPHLMHHATKGELFVPPVVHDVKVMSMGFLLQADQPVVWRGPMLHGIIQQFCHQVDWGECDYLIVDMPPGTGDVQLSLAQLVPLTAAVLVSTANEVSMQDVRKAYFMFEKVKVPILGVVENMSCFICDGCDKVHTLFSQGGGKILANRLNIELLAEIPFTPLVSASSDAAKPFVLAHADHKASQVFSDLAQKIAQKSSILSHQMPQPTIDIGKFH